MDLSWNRLVLGTVLAAALAACSPAAKPPSIPVAIEGGWQQTGVSSPANPAPLLGTHVPVQVHQASFAGPSPLTVTYYRMSSDTVAFELMQKWRSEPGATHFHNGPLFVVVRAEGLEPARLNAIAKQAEEALKR